jgi:hypothetical protein
MAGPWKPLPKDHGRLSAMDASYSYLRQFTPNVLAAIDFKGGPGTIDLMAAVAMLKMLNETGGRKVPADAPDSFVPTRYAQRPLFDGPGLLRPRPAAPERPDHPPPAPQHLRSHRRRPGILRLLHQGPRPVLAPLFAAGQPQAPPQLRAAIKTIEHHIDKRLAQSRLPATA